MTFDLRHTFKVIEKVSSSGLPVRVSEVQLYSIFIIIITVTKLPELEVLAVLEVVAVVVLLLLLVQLVADLECVVVRPAFVR